MEAKAISYRSNVAVISVFGPPLQGKAVHLGPHLKRPWNIGGQDFGNQHLDFNLLLLGSGRSDRRGHESLARDLRGSSSDHERCSLNGATSDAKVDNPQKDPFHNKILVNERDCICEMFRPMNVHQRGHWTERL